MRGWYLDPSSRGTHDCIGPGTKHSTALGCQTLHVSRKKCSWIDFLQLLLLSPQSLSPEMPKGSCSEQKMSSLQLFLNLPEFRVSCVQQLWVKFQS